MFGGWLFNFLTRNLVKLFCPFEAAVRLLLGAICPQLTCPCQPVKGRPLAWLPGLCRWRSPAAQGCLFPLTVCRCGAGLGLLYRTLTTATAEPAADDAACKTHRPDPMRSGASSIAVRGNSRCKPHPIDPEPLR